MLELYHAGLSTCSKQVRATLHEKGLDYVSHYVEFRRFEHYTPEYLKINPAGLIPALVHDGRPIVNSVAIMEYIDDVWPEPRLRPADPMLRADMRRWMSFSDYVHSSLMMATYARMLKPAADMLSEEQKQLVLDHIVIPDRFEKSKKLYFTGISDDDVGAALRMVRYCLDRMEEAVQNSTWMVGEEFSLADCSLLAVVHRIEEVAPDIISRDTHPAVFAWRDRLYARPAIAATLEVGTPETPADRPPPDTAALEAA